VKVRILGGGVAALGCALALIRRAGIRDVRLFERESAEGMRRKVGHGLLLIRTGVKALRALGAAHILDGCTPLRRTLIQDAAGSVVHVDTLEDVYCVTRAQIVQGLGRELPPGMMLVDHDCQRVGMLQARVQAVRFRQQPPLEALDLLVGADGGRSVLCGALNPGYRRPRSRVREVVTSTVMPGLAARIRNVFCKTLFPDRALAFGLLAPTAERVIGFLQYDAERYSPPRDATAADLGRFLRALLGGAPEPVRTYLAAADLASAHLWCPPDADLPPRLHCDNAVLIGDAAHPLLPFTSQGVSAALEDAVVLADCLARREALAGALAAFTRKRRRSLAAFVEGGRRILSSFFDTAQGFELPYLNGAA
jgi:2-polyprenyl-6-methoxyphenol hydroxylase-like FAD-dependent oxidoreductase